MSNIKIRTLLNDIVDMSGKTLPKGISIVMEQTYSLIKHYNNEPCLVYLDNGGDRLQDWTQHVVLKSKVYENSK